MEAEELAPKKARRKTSHTKVSRALLPRRRLEDHVFNFGLAKNASEFNTNARFIINYIRRTYDEGRDIADALEKGKDMDFDAIAPIMKPITADPTNTAAYKMMKLQHAEDYKMKLLQKYTELREKHNFTDEQIVSFYPDMKQIVEAKLNNQK